MSTAFCSACGARLGADGRRCAGCGAPTPRSPVRGWLGAVALLLFGGLGGYMLGPGIDRVARAGEAASDAVLPITSAMREREGVERLRAELERYVLIQEQFYRDHGRYRNSQEVHVDPPFEMNYADGVSGTSWLADLHVRGQLGAWCAVAVGRVPAYSMGVVLKQSGRVRCSRDLSTRINLFLRQITPVRFSS